MNTNDSPDEFEYQSFADTLDNETQAESQEKQVEPAYIPFTKWELERLIEQRNQSPTLEPRLTIGGDIEKEVNAELDRERENRISHIEERLGFLKNRARDDFNMTQQQQDLKEIECDDGYSR